MTIDADGQAPAALQASGLECVRGERRLFDKLNLTVEPGQCLHVAGANGAGKTSLLRILAGLLLPTSGSVRWRGQEIASAREEFGSELAFVGHLNGIKEELTVLENVCFEAATRGGDDSEQAALRALERLGLRPYADRFARHLSQGQKRRVALARLCGTAPARLWILDEPFNALDTAAIATLHDIIAEQMARGGMIVLTVHQQIELPAATRRLELAESAPA